MEISNLLKVFLIFLFGFLIANLLNFYVATGSEIPFLRQFGLGMSYDNNAPFDNIHENQIEINEDSVIIHVKNASLGKYAATGSMKPVLDENSNGIRIVPSSKEEIHLGDVITYQDNNDLIIHRVVEIGNDENGWYVITKGDNNDVSDGKVRYSQIKFITIGILW